ncbi:MAG: hypothetical protein D6812_11670 [Deltaproteobacteria bacterium]|nr:MAG: hypothetical protein D6812_11670 [Deltaproteobacteria bacterium]
MRKAFIFGTIFWAVATTASAGFEPGTLVGLDYERDALVVIDKETGEAQPVGELGVDVDATAGGLFTALAFGRDGRLYGSTGGKLYLIDQETGGATLIGDLAIGREGLAPADTLNHLIGGNSSPAAVIQLDPFEILDEPQVSTFDIDAMDGTPDGKVFMVDVASPTTLATVTFAWRGPGDFEVTEDFRIIGRVEAVPFGLAYDPEEDVLYGSRGSLLWRIDPNDVANGVVASTLVGNGVGAVSALAIATEPLPDEDGDLIPDSRDNCPLDANPDQSDLDLDGLGDTCDCAPEDTNEPGEDGECPVCGLPAVIGDPVSPPLAAPLAFLLALPLLIDRCLRTRSRADRR